MTVTVTVTDHITVTSPLRHITACTVTVSSVKLTLGVIYTWNVVLALDGKIAEYLLSPTLTLHSAHLDTDQRPLLQSFET